MSNIIEIGGGASGSSEIDKVYFQDAFAKGDTPLTITLLETANKTSHIKLTGSVWAPSIPTGYTATTGTISNNSFTTIETSEYHWNYVQEFDITCGDNNNAVIVYNGGLNQASEVSLNVYHIYYLAAKTITQNGTYRASDDSADGYNEITVNVSGGGGVVYKNYLKFNGYGIVLPWTLNSDYKIEVVFYETTYLQDSAIIGNTYNETRSNLTEYNNAYFTSTGTGGSGFGSWASGEHTFITNNGNGKNEFDGVEVTNYIPTTDNTINYSIGWRKTAGNAFKGWIKSYKVYSISSGDLLHELKPALVMGSSCFYDTIEEKIYSTSLVEAVDTIS